MTTEICDLLLIPDEFAGIDEFHTLELWMGGGLAGQTQTQSGGGSVTASGTLNVRVRASFAGSTTPAGTLGTSGPSIDTQSVGGALTGAGTVNDVTIFGDAAQGTVVPSGTVATNVITGAGFTQAVGGSCSPFGAMTMRILKTLSGVVAVNGSVKRVPKLRFSGAVTAGGTAQSTSTAPGAVFTWVTGGASTPVGALTGLKLKMVVGGSCRPAGVSNQKAGALIVAGSMTPSGVLGIYESPPAPVITSVAQITARID